MVKGLEVNPSGVRPDCHGCTEEKQHCDFFQEKDQHKKQDKLELIHTDVLGNVNLATWGGQFLRTDSNG